MTSRLKQEQLAYIEQRGYGFLSAEEAFCQLGPVMAGFTVGDDTCRPSIIGSTGRAPIVHLSRYPQRGRRFIIEFKPNVP